MKSKRKVLIVAKDQFGYSTTLFKHCQYLKDYFEITYIGWDFNRAKVELPGITVKYVSRDGNKATRTLRLIKSIRKNISNFDIAFGTYFLGISLVKILGIKVPYKVYIDTLYVANGGLKKFFSDSILRVELLFFKDVLVISHGVAKKIGLKSYRILPLGGESFKTKFEHQTEELNLLYVGTLGRRKILECIQGYHRFLSTQENKEKFMFRVVGDSDTGEREEIDRYISENSFQPYIKMYGYVPQHELYKIYDQSNLGISFVPLFEEFDKQPPTKTYEYLVSGLPIIATATTSNKEIVTDKDGLLIEDSSEAFSNALTKMYHSIKSYQPSEIRKRNERYKWKNVVEKNLMPVLN